MEEHRSLRPTAFQGLGTNDQVPSLTLFAALKVWDHGEELPAHDLPLERRKFIFPRSTARNTSQYGLFFGNPEGHLPDSTYS